MLDRSLIGLADERLLVYGGLLLAALYLVPDGAAGALRRLVARLSWAAPPLPVAERADGAGPPGAAAATGRFCAWTA